MLSNEFDLQHHMRPHLNEVKQIDAGVPVMTIDLGAWNEIIETAYDSGFCLLEVDRFERPIRALQRSKYLN